MATRISAYVTVAGPLLEGQGPAILQRFFDDATKLVAEHGRDELRKRATSKPKRPTGAFARSVVVKQFGRSRAINATYPGVTYGPWLEGTSARNTSTRFKGYRMFKLTRGRLRKQVGDLVQGLLDRAVAQLGGGR
jgi:hypothetical protein